MPSIKYSVKNSVNILYTVLWSIFTHTNSTTQYKQCVFKYLLKTNLNWAFLLLRHVRLRGKLLKILMPAENVLRNHERVAFGL
jgi:hypothetical protein